jgi:phosphate-selective porin
LYVRPFQGGFLYFLQNIANTKHQVMVKYDWYDPNTKADGASIGNPVSNFGEADIKFSTLGAGYLYHVNSNLKILLYYEWVKNETTALTGYTSDRSDNILTIRTQFRF